MNIISLSFTFPKWVNLTQRSQYFATLLNYVKSDNDSRHPSLSIDYTDYPVIWINISFQYPDHISPNPNTLFRILDLLSRDDFAPIVFFREISDYQTLILCLDYFNVDIWDAIFEQYFQRHMFEKKNSFFQVMMASFPEGHIVIERAFKFISSVLGITSAEMSCARQTKTLLGLAEFFRSTVRRSYYHDNQLVHYTCIVCKSTVASRGNLPNYELDGGRRISCCASPVCNTCPFVYQSVTCPICHEFVTDDAVYNSALSTVQSRLSRRNIRLGNGVPLEFDLPQFPPLFQLSCRRKPCFVVPWPEDDDAQVSTLDALD